MSLKNKISINNKNISPKKYTIEQEIINIYTNLNNILTTRDLFIFNQAQILNNIIDKNDLKKASIKIIIEKIKTYIKIILDKLHEVFKEKIQMENNIIKLENDIRKNIKEILENKMEKELYIIKIHRFSKINEEYEQLKDKVKYNKGKFLNDDKKENEILILRQENSNLKNEIKNLENTIKEYKMNKIINNNIKINSYNKKFSSHNKSKSKEKSYKNILNTSYSNKRVFNQNIKKENDMNKTMKIIFKEKAKNRVIKNV